MEITHLKILNLKSFNWEGAIQGMRNALESWPKMDSDFSEITHPKLGLHDRELALKLCKAGSEHRKFMRQIFVSGIVIAPWYWWKEQETYQVGTTENSTSQMHKMGSRLLTHDDFVIDHWLAEDEELLKMINHRIVAWQADKENKIIWRSLIQIIPGSFIYRRNISLNYEVLTAQFKQRKAHKLIEWREYLYQMITMLPYPELFTLGELELLNIKDPNFSRL